MSGISANTSPQRARVKIVTVDPATRRVEGAMKDGSIAHVAIWDDIPSNFRWPKEQEVWVIERGQNLVWRLVSRVQQGEVSGSGTNVTIDKETLPIESMTSGMMKLDSINIVDGKGRNLVIADLVGVQENWTLRWDTTLEVFVVEPFPTPTILASQQYSDYTFQLRDAWTIVESMSATPVTWTIPTHASVPLAIETIIEIFQNGAGQVNFVGAPGVTLLSDSGRHHTAAQYATTGIRQRALDFWVISGDLV